MLFLPLAERLKRDARVVTSVFIRCTDADSLKQPFDALGFVLAFTSSWHRYPHLIIENRALPGAVREPKEPNSSKEVLQKEQHGKYTTLSIGFALKIDQALVEAVKPALHILIGFGQGFAKVPFDVLGHGVQPRIE